MNGDVAETLEQITKDSEDLKRKLQGGISMSNNTLMNSSRECVYVAGPLATGEVDEDLIGNPRAQVLQYIRNCNRMINVSIKLIEKGHAPFIPALDFMTGLVAGDFDFSKYFGVSEMWLRKSDSFFLIKPSMGALKEKALAEKLGKKIYTSMEEVPTIAIHNSA